MHPHRRLLLLFLLQVILCVYGNFIFVNRVNPFALLLTTLALVYYAALELKNKPPDPTRPEAWTIPFLHGLVGVGAIIALIGPISKVFQKFPDPSKFSDVIPQMKGQADLFFSGQFPYIPIETVSHRPYPVYLPLQWMPFQISNILRIDARWTGVILFAAGVFVAGYFLRKHYNNLPLIKSLLRTILLVFPFWAFVQWSKKDVGVSAEGVVAFWYLLLATGLAVKNRWLLFIGLVGGILSRYSLLVWLPLLALLLWYYESKRYSFIIWGGVIIAVLGLFVVPFLLKDPSILAKMSAHYAKCDEGSWVYPDEYTYQEGLSLNIHLREWLPGKPADSLPYAHWPQLLVQLLCMAGGWVYYRREGHRHFDMYTYALLALTLMPMLLYIFSPMVFRYYMLMPLSISAVLCWRVWVNSPPHTSTIL